jgi:peptidoglycan/xylan/chitin deacetylase (PgdA/CDA1 family)
MANQALKDTVYRVAGRMLQPSPFTKAFFSTRPNMIFHHGVWERGTPRRDLFTGIYVDQFRDDLRVLGRSFEFVGIDSILGAPSEPGKRPRLHLTFDDGFDLIGGGAANVLEEFGAPATVFVNTASVNGGHLMWQHRISAVRCLRGDAAFVDALNGVQERAGLPGRAAAASDQIRLTRHWPADRKDEYTTRIWEACRMPALDGFIAEHQPYMDWEALRRWSARGNTVGFHTHSHPFCSQLNDEQVAAEVLAPVDMLRQQLGVTAVPFAYPFGDRLPADKEAAVVKTGAFTCLLGTGGFSACGTVPAQLERVEAEPDVHAEIFGRPLVQWLRGRTPESVEYH